MIKASFDGLDGVVHDLAVEILVTPVLAHGSAQTKTKLCQSVVNKRAISRLIEETLPLAFHGRRAA